MREKVLTEENKGNEGPTRTGQWQKNGGQEN
jgi:hypothetical protein